MSFLKTKMPGTLAVLLAGLVFLLAACAASDSDSEGDSTSANVTTTDSDTATTTEDKDFWFGWENTFFTMNAVLRDNLGATSGGKSFKPSAVPPPSDVASYRLGSGIEVLGWLDGTTIYYYAKGYTDSNKKIPVKCLVGNAAPLFFGGCTGIKSMDLSAIDTSNVTCMSEMFYGCSSLEKLDLSGWNMSKVSNMGWMFHGCSSLEKLDLSSPNMRSVANTSAMFWGCSKLKTIYISSDRSWTNEVSGDNMFDGCTQLVGGQGTAYSSEHIDGTYAHIDGGSSNPGYFTEK